MQEGTWIGVDVDVEGVVNTLESGVWEPVVNKVRPIPMLPDRSQCS